MRLIQTAIQGRPWVLTHRNAHSNALAVYQGRPLLAQPGPLHGLVSPCERSCAGSYQKEKHALLQRIIMDHSYLCARVR